MARDIHRLASAIEDGASIEEIAEHTRRIAGSAQSFDHRVTGLMEGKIGTFISGLYIRFNSVSKDLIGPDEVEADRKLFRDAMSALTASVRQNIQAQKRTLRINNLQYYLIWCLTVAVVALFILVGIELYYIRQLWLFLQNS